MAIRPGFKTISQRNAAHVQQRSFSIHAESFQVCQNQASLIKASAGKVRAVGLKQSYDNIIITSPWHLGCGSLQ